MECAGRGLAFWSYQSTQEIVYQEYLAKTLTDKYSTLNHQLDKVIGDANSEIENLNQRLNRKPHSTPSASFLLPIFLHALLTHDPEMHLDQTKLKTDNTQLLAALREKNRKHAQTQELYDRLKAKEMTAATQQHAFDSADDVLQSAVRSQVQGHGQGHQNHQNQNGYNQNQGINLDIHQLRRQGPSPLGGHFSGSGGRRSTSPNKMHQTSHFVGDRNGVMGPPPIPRPGQGIGNSGFVTHPTPQHRTRLGGLSATFATNTNTNSSGGNALFRTNATNSFGPNSFQAQGQGQGQGQGQTPRIRRPPLGPISGNTPSAGLGGGSGVSGYGMSAGMRSGSVLGGTGSGSGDGVGGGGFGWEHGGF
ncbi:hypothetical protein MMC10_008116 [Thelotrema lepadinum]|nr:hypothetical protein [Thelotrema lepadinum]